MMNPSRCGLLLLGLVLMLSGRSAIATTLVYNGSFELFIDGWTYEGSWPPILTRGAAHGTNFYSQGAGVSQQIATKAGETYSIRFAVKDHLVPAVYFGGERVDLNVPATNYFFRWKYVDGITPPATGSVTTLRFEGNAFDDVTVVGMLEPLTVIAQPESRSVYENGAVSFRVYASGGVPISYLWHFNGTPIEGATNASLLLTNVGFAQQGSYSVLLSNAVGTLESHSATLSVQPLPAAPVIVSQPEGDMVPAGYAFNLKVVAIGHEPLSYQWFLNAAPVAAGTNRVLRFTAIDATNAGIYSVRVANPIGDVASLPATLSVTNQPGGGQVYFGTLSGLTRAPIFDYDGMTLIEGSNYVAQLYAGASPTILRPVGPQQPFATNTGAGFFYTATIQIPDVPIGQTVYVQTRVWEAGAGVSFEDARARGSKWGTSDVYTMEGLAADTPLRVPMLSFSLRAGSPQFTTGILDVNRRDRHLPLEWKLTGESNSRYLIEKRTPPQSWAPLFVVTNLSGSVLFTDTNATVQQMNFYRARMLD